MIRRTYHLRSNEKEISHRRVSCKHAELISPKGRWLHRLVRRAGTTARPSVPGSLQIARDVVRGSTHPRDSHTHAPNRARSPASDPGPPSKGISPVPTGEPDSWRCT